MARKPRNDLDYFPHDKWWWRKMWIIEKKFWNNWYATWYKILEQLCSNSYHYIDLREEDNVMFLSANCNIEEEELMLIIEHIVKIWDFDKELREWYKIIRCQKFIDSISDAYSRRKNDCITRELLCKHLWVKCMHKWNKCNTENKFMKENSNSNAQTKLNNNKSNNNKSNNINTNTNSSKISKQTVQYNFVSEFVNQQKSFHQVEYQIKKHWMENYLHKQNDAVRLLLKDWYTLENIKLVLGYVLWSEFRRNQVMTVTKLRSKNKDKIPRISILLDKALKEKNDYVKAKQSLQSHEVL